MNVDREIGRLTGQATGATLIAVAAIHGNEQAGIHASKRVLDKLGARMTGGELVVLAGNVGAIRENRRFRTRDLNRMWTESIVSSIEKRGAGETEDGEVLELLLAIRAAVARARGPVYLVDLHTTSAAGVPFALFGDTTPAQRAFAGAFPLPVIMGLEEQLVGVLSAYFRAHGCTTIAVEGGQHDDPATVDNLEAVLLVAAEAAGLVTEHFIDAHELLSNKRADLPRLMQVISRHAIKPEDAFEMMPGFRNLDYARTEQLLARDRAGEIRAKSDGLVILPLYQGQGDDGFFWGREVDAADLTK